LKKVLRVLSGSLFISLTVIEIASGFPSGRLTERDTLVNGRIKRIYQTEETSNPPKIDGILNDLCWKEGSWSSGYKQFMPAEGAKPTAETEIKILFDRLNIYVAIRAFDDPDKIDRQMGRRDHFNGDIVGICFDSYFDHRAGFEFDLTAAGVKLDILLYNGGWDTNWDAVWYGEVGFEDSAWVAEMQIPLSQLRYDNNEEQIWGMHSWRWINRNQEEDQWNLMPRDNNNFLHYFGEIHGIRNISRSRKMELMPFSLAKLSTSKPEEGNPFVKGKEINFNAGLDGKIGIASNFTLDFTINPDFGQVEADPAELNLTVFETRFEEKRPFFLEGNNILQFNAGGNLLFYTRRIGHAPVYSPDPGDSGYVKSPENTTILGALKLTGKTKNGLSVGIIESITQREMLKFNLGESEYKEAAEPLSNYFVARIQQDLNQGNTFFGGMLTSVSRFLEDEHLKESLSREAVTGGLDFEHHWKNRTFFTSFSGFFSYIKGDVGSIISIQESSSRYFQRPDADHLDIDSARTNISGYGATLKFGKEGNGRWRYSENFSFLSPGLELNDMGFSTTADEINQNTTVQYIENQPKGIFREYAVDISQSNYWNTGGEHLSSDGQLDFVLLFQNKWGFSTGFLRRSSSLDTRLLRGGPAMMIKGFWHNDYNLTTDVSRKFSLKFRIHYHLYDDKISRFHNISQGIVYKPLNSLQLSADINYDFNKDGFQFVEPDEYESSDIPYVVATLSRKTLGLTIRIDFALSPEFTIQYYGNPYVSTGRYADFKHILNARANDFGEQFILLKDNQIEYSAMTDQYTVYLSNPVIPDYTISNPDFNYLEFRSNLVARWEFRPGSALYLVWTQGRRMDSEVSDYSLAGNIGKIYSIFPDNVFLVKLNYWFSI
jgi:hypothetical protein